MIEGESSGEMDMAGVFRPEWVKPENDASPMSPEEPAIDGASRWEFGALIRELVDDDKSGRIDELRWRRRFDGEAPPRLIWSVAAKSLI